MKQAKQSRKTIKPLKAILIVLCIILLMAILAVCAVGISLAVRYRNHSFEYQPPVERDESDIKTEYEYPDVILDPTPSAGEDVLPQDTETEDTVPPEESAETTDVPQVDPADTTAASPVDPSDSAEDTQGNIPEETAPPAETAPSASAEETTAPAETLAPVVNVPDTPKETYKPVYNPDASFANSPNAVSVYGKVPVYKVEQKDEDIINILVLGTDSLDITRDRGRSDTMIIVSYNQKTGSIKLTSILRDSLVPIDGHNWNRINTAYFFGGVGLAINTVNDLFDLDIQQFIVIDLNGAKNLVDHVGGVNLTLTKEEAELYNIYFGTQYTEGVNYMTGVHLLQHMRNRELGSDFERTRRQRDAIVAIMDKLLTEKSLVELYEIADYSFDLVKTNIPLSTLTSLVTSAIGNMSNLTVTAQHVPYSDSYRFATYKGMAVISFDIEDAAERINEFIYGDGEE